jgi:sigma-B regulation protein RsbU (phosphoserine phosphatase)
MESKVFASPESRAEEQRQLMKKVEQVVSEIEQSSETGDTIQRVAVTVLDRFRDVLGITGGRLYRWVDGDYEIVASFPEPRPDLFGTRLPACHPTVLQLADDHVVYMAPGDPLYDREFEARIGVEAFAAIEVDEEEFLLSFDVAPDIPRADVLFSLGMLRHAINQKLRQERVEEVFEQARRIQVSILPRRVPEYGDFDLWGQTIPMDQVGGDFYDFIPLTDKILGLAIADVSGHGLPAALQVRDIYMGLRMGLARDLKIVRTVERMNQIIHRSTLTSRFVSMFYGELELSGIFIYVNAGHPPPFLLSADGEVKFLEEGGAVLGPVGDATYERGFVRLAPGDMIVMYTDGLIEAAPPGGLGDEAAEYGIDRMIELARSLRGKPAREVVESLLADVERFSGDTPPNDDRTVLVVTRPA